MGGTFLFPRSSCAELNISPETSFAKKPVHAARPSLLCSSLEPRMLVKHDIIQEFVADLGSSTDYKMYSRSNRSSCTVGWDPTPLTSLGGNHPWGRS